MATFHTPRREPERASADPVLLLDSRGRMYELPRSMLERFEVDPARVAELARALPRNEDGTLRVPAWIDLSGLEAEVEAQGRATNFASAVLLALAGCAGPVGTLRVEQDVAQCVAVEMVDEELAGVSEEETCLETFDVELPAGAHQVRVSAADGVVFDGRIYVKPNTTERLRLGIGTVHNHHDWTIHEPSPFQPSDPVTPGVVEAGSVLVSASDHAGTAPATVTVAELEGELAARGTTGEPLVVRPGDYLVTTRLIGTADLAEQTQRVHVRPGEVVSIGAQFATGILEVQVHEDREPVFATIHLVRNAQDVGTLGSHVAWKVSAGTYELRIEHRGNVQYRTVEDVHVEPGQRLSVRVDL